jgi:hypothetical protein
MFIVEDIRYNYILYVDQSENRLDYEWGDVYFQRWSDFVFAVN